MSESCVLSVAHKQKLEQWVAAAALCRQVAMRFRIVLAAAGKSEVSVYKRLAVNRNTMILWRQRFAAEELDGLRPH